MLLGADLLLSPQNGSSYIYSILRLETLRVDRSRIHFDRVPAKRHPRLPHNAYGDFFPGDTVILLSHKTKKPYQNDRASGGTRVSGWKYADNLPLMRTFDAKLNLSLDFCEERVVPSHANIIAGMNTGSALPDNDASGRDDFATKAFHA